MIIKRLAGLAGESVVTWAATAVGASFADDSSSFLESVSVGRGLVLVAVGCCGTEGCFSYSNFFKVIQKMVEK